MKVASIIKTSYVDESYYTNGSRFVQIFIFGLSTPGQLLLKEAEADPLPKYLLKCPSVNVTKSSEKAATDPTRLQSMIRSGYFVIGYMVCMVTVNNTNNT